MTDNLDALRAEAKELGVNSVHLFKSADKLQAAIDKAKANEPVPFTQQPKKDEAEPVTPEAPAPAPMLLLQRDFYGAPHKIWVAADKLEEWQQQGYRVIG